MLLSKVYLLRFVSLCSCYDQQSGQTLNTAEKVARGANPREVWSSRNDLINIV